MGEKLSGKNIENEIIVRSSRIAAGSPEENAIAREATHLFFATVKRRVRRRAPKNLRHPKTAGDLLKTYVDMRLRLRREAQEVDSGVQSADTCVFDISSDTTDSCEEIEDEFRARNRC